MDIFATNTAYEKFFLPKWIKWVETFIMGGSDEIGHFFQTKKVLCQGDTLCPLLFNTVADMLTVLINRAKEDVQLSGVVPHLVDGDLLVL